MFTNTLPIAINTEKPAFWSKDKKCVMYFVLAEIHPAEKNVSKYNINLKTNLTIKEFHSD